MELIKNFVRDESGAVTVDWVVLTAAIVGLALAVVASVRTGVGSLGSKISSEISNNIPVVGATTPASP